MREGETMAAKSKKKSTAKLKSSRRAVKDLPAKSASAIKGGATKYEDITVNCGAGMAKN